MSAGVRRHVWRSCKVLTVDMAFPRPSLSHRTSTERGIERCVKATSRDARWLRRVARRWRETFIHGLAGNGTGYSTALSSSILAQLVHKAPLFVPGINTSIVKMSPRRYTHKNAREANFQSRRPIWNIFCSVTTPAAKVVLVLVVDRREGTHRAKLRPHFSLCTYPTTDALLTTARNIQMFHQDRLKLPIHVSFERRVPRRAAASWHERLRPPTLELASRAFFIEERTVPGRAGDSDALPQYATYPPHSAAKTAPLHPSDPIPTQTQTFVQNSLKNVRTTYLHSFLLHSSLSRLIHNAAAWRAIVELQYSDTVRTIGPWEQQHVRQVFVGIVASAGSSTNRYGRSPARALPRRGASQSIAGASVGPASAPASPLPLGTIAYTSPIPRLAPSVRVTDPPNHYRSTRLADEYGRNLKIASDVIAQEEAYDRLCISGKQGLRVKVMRINDTRRFNVFEVQLFFRLAEILRDHPGPLESCMTSNVDALETSTIGRLRVFNRPATNLGFQDVEMDTDGSGVEDGRSLKPVALQLFGVSSFLVPPFAPEDYTRAPIGRLASNSLIPVKARNLATQAVANNVHNRIIGVEVRRALLRQAPRTMTHLASLQRNPSAAMTYEKPL
ncbi:uncharacterized protein C8Q71DRAFT_886817 [Rhodofomes roseus]|uniref:Uncharacterized protein n=1 Tax=Rhodofomes roseus TaxID=34475 RepID=A0ABQ8K122_9APHY|nr:uncharacterized protein C8Q71DRAFT_886817 [Rhodofomes roseus]KAH9830348.1 hypothetical protein C8Q71DRAFT_886817 [Rhodofomes roseus]